MPAVKPAIFAVEQGEQFPHRSAPVDHGLDIRRSFLRVFAVLGKWFRDRAAMFHPRPPDDMTSRNRERVRHTANRRNVNSFTLVTHRSS